MSNATDPLLEVGESTSLDTPDWRSLEVTRRRDDETTGEVFFACERADGESIDLERSEIEQLALLAGFAVAGTPGTGLVHTKCVYCESDHKYLLTTVTQNDRFDEPEAGDTFHSFDCQCGAKERLVYKVERDNSSVNQTLAAAPGENDE